MSILSLQDAPASSHLTPSNPGTPRRERKQRRSRLDLYQKVGNDKLCAWPLPYGCAIQTRVPELAENLSRIAGAHLAVQNVSAHFVRVFHYARSWRWAKRYVARRLVAEPTAERKQARTLGIDNRVFRPLEPSQILPRVNTAEHNSERALSA